MARTRRRKQRSPAQIPALTRRKKWWKKGDMFTVEYIERAISVKVGKDPWTWIYVTKWYLYSRRENTMECADTFADCKYPILERFWASIGKAIPKGCVEPEPEPTNGSYEIFDSTQAYRRKEAKLTLKMDREDEAREEESDEPAETVESVGQDSDTEGKALQMIDSMTHLELGGETMALPSSFGKDLFLPVHDSPDSSYTTDSETSIYEPEVAPATPPPTTTDVKHTEKGRSFLLSNGTVAPLDTIRTNTPNVFGPGRRLRAPRMSSAINYMSLRPGTMAPGSFSLFAGGDFRSTPLISLHDKNTMPFRRHTHSSREGRRKGMQFYSEPYTKPVDETLLKRLGQEPPKMPRAAWDTVANETSSQAGAAEADTLFDEFVAEPEPPMRTLQDFPIQALDLNVAF